MSGPFVLEGAAQGHGCELYSSTGSARLPNSATVDRAGNVSTPTLINAICGRTTKPKIEALHFPRCPRSPPSNKEQHTTTPNAGSTQESCNSERPRPLNLFFGRGARDGHVFAMFRRDGVRSGRLEGSDGRDVVGREATAVERAQEAVYSRSGSDSSVTQTRSEQLWILSTSNEQGCALVHGQEARTKRVGSGTNLGRLWSGSAHAAWNEADVRRP